MNLERYSDACYYFYTYETKVNKHKKTTWKIKLLIEQIMLYFKYKPKFYKDLELQLLNNLNMTLREAYKYVT